MTQRARIQHLPTGEWRLDTDKGTYRVSSINAHCTKKLQSLHDAQAPVYLTLEPIPAYASDEYRTRIHPSVDDWDDKRDVYCLVSEVPVSDDDTPVSQDEIDDVAAHLILDAFFGLVEDGIFEIVEEDGKP